MGRVATAAVLFGIFAAVTPAHGVDFAVFFDYEGDGLSDMQEARHNSNPFLADTDGDGFSDGEEVQHGYDPVVPGEARLPKRIVVDLSEQRLRWYYGELGEQGNFLISSGGPGYGTPTGTYAVRRKLPVARFQGYMRGRYYDYPNTKWNLEFAPSYYIHGAYWHTQFGTARSKGCINVAYENMGPLYAWADEGTTVVIRE